MNVVRGSDCGASYYLPWMTEENKAPNLDAGYHLYES
jgi:hypothetical protein